MLPKIAGCRNLDNWSAGQASLSLRDGENVALIFIEDGAPFPPQLQAAFDASEPIWRAEQAVRASKLNLVNKTKDLFKRFIFFAQTTGVADLDIHLLMNHAVPGVNAGYIDRSKLLSDHLRLQQEMISRKIIEAVRGRSIGKMQISANWPLLPARGALKDVLQRAEDGVVSSQLMAA